MYNTGILTLGDPFKKRLIEKQRRLKRLNHERWDLIDKWVERRCQCKFKVRSRKVYIIEAFRNDAFQKRSNGFQFSW